VGRDFLPLRHPDAQDVRRTPDDETRASATGGRTDPRDKAEEGKGLAISGSAMSYRIRRWIFGLLLAQRTGIFAIVGSRGLVI
jgi:hypothetical protein